MTSNIASMVFKIKKVFLNKVLGERDYLVARYAAPFSDFQYLFH